MARSISLGALRASVCARADVVDGGATGRHTTAALNGYINDAIQEFRRLVTDCGVTWYIKQAAVTTSTDATVDASSWAPRDYLTMPSDFYHLEGIDITTGGATVPMLDFMTLERDMFKLASWWLTNNGLGMPVLYKLGGYNAAGNLVTKVIPSADGVYSCTIWYLPVAVDLVLDADTFDDIAGYDKWIINNAAMSVLMRDGATQPTYSTLAAENVRLEQQMRFQFASAAGPGHRLDSRKLRERIICLAGIGLGGGGSGGGSVTLYHIYHGAAVTVTTEANIKALAADVLAATRSVPNYAATALGANYEWFCLPSSLGTPVFTDATTSFGIPFDNMGVVNVTNSSGTAPYTVWRSHFPAIGTSGTIVIKVT